MSKFIKKNTSDLPVQEENRGKKNSSPFEAVVMGVSFGGLEALHSIFSVLSPGFPAPIMVVQHLAPNTNDFLANYLDNCCPLQVKTAEEKEHARSGFAYLAPPNYHLLVEDDHSFSLSGEGRINYARPAIDVLFESAADVYGAQLIGVILTGANDDGSRGLMRIKEYGGLAVVQDPDTAQAAFMPEAALLANDVDYILPLAEIGGFLNTIFNI